MKILLDHPQPFSLAHGGFQIQIEQTHAALNRLGVETEYLQWWNPVQRGDLIHYFGRPSIGYLQQAHQKGCPVILAELLTGLGSRPLWPRMIQKAVIHTAQTILPPIATNRFGWQAFREADACVALTGWEAQLMREVFGAVTKRIHIIPNGVEEVFFTAAANASRGKWLVCTATITERKRVLELASTAVLAQTPVWIIGRPYAENDAYAIRFQQLAAQHPSLIRYEGGVNDRARLAQIYREARGFVLLSTMESLSLSALEAAASGCPLLLSDLPWARSTFAADANYCPVASPEKTAGILENFYAAAPGLPVPPKPQTWLEVAQQLRQVYEEVLSTSR